MKKINVCHVVSGLKAGGVESMIYNYCSHLDSDNYSFHILYQHEPNQKNVEEFKKLGFKLKRIPSKLKHPLKNYFETKKYFKNNNIDVVHCHMTMMNFIPLLAAKKLKIKTRICHSHNSDVRKKNIFIKIIESILKKICIFTATDLVSCGKEAGYYMYGLKNKYTIINNALNLDNYLFSDLKRKQIREKYDIPNDCFVIGHVGRFTEQKNHKFLIDVFKKILVKNQKVALFLIGDGELNKKIRERCEKENIDNHVYFIGVVDNVCDYYSAFDVFVLPSLWEGLPVVSIEAQTSGLKCIFSSNIDKNAIIYNKNAKLVTLDTSQWIENIILNIEKGNQYNRKVDMQLLHESGYDINVELDKLKKIYIGGNNE